MTPRFRGRTVRTALMSLTALAVLTLSACGSGTDAHPLGTQVTTPFFSLVGGTEQGPGTITVTAVRTGTIADLTTAGFELDPAQTRTTPHYVDVTFTNSGDGTIDLRDPSGIDQNEDLVPSLTVLDLGDGPAFEKCPLLPATLAAHGSVDGCAIVLVPDGVELQRISFLPDVSKEFVYWDTGR